MKKLSVVFSSLALVGAVSTASASTWDIDQAHGEVGFSVRHLMVSDTKGKFNKFAGTLNLDEKDVTRSVVNVEIDATSIDTNQDKRDEHLRSPDFFDTAKHPKITFKSTRVEKAGKNLKVHGNLTLRGVTKPVVLDVEGPGQEVKDPWGGIHSAVKASTRINRKDFGLTWNKALETGGAVVGDEVTINIEVELLKQVAAKK